jgi:hypothetical protein
LLAADAGKNTEAILCMLEIVRQGWARPACNSEAELLSCLMLAQMQWLGECASPWTINSEIKKLVGDGPPQGKLFRFFRYDIRLEEEWLRKKLRVQLSAKEIDRLRAMDDPTVVEPLFGLARAAAEYQVRGEDWNTPCSRDGSS